MGFDHRPSKLLLDELVARNERVRTERLAAAKDEAQERGKEPFDLAVLESLVDTFVEGRRAPAEARRRRLEEMYYVEHAELMTLAELARLVEEMQRW